MSFLLDQDLGFLLARTYLAMRRRLTSPLEPLGVTHSRFRVLNALCEQGNVSQMALAARTAADKTSPARMLERMEGAGSIRREADPDDSRAHRVLLTEKGRQVQSRVIPQRDLALRSALEGLDGEEVKEPKRLLNQVYANTSRDR